MPDRVTPQRSPNPVIRPFQPVRQTNSRYFRGGVEPRIADMLKDPIVALMMDRDHVSPADVISVMQRAADRAG